MMLHQLTFQLHNIVHELVFDSAKRKLFIQAAWTNGRAYDIEEMMKLPQAYKFDADFKETMAIVKSNLTAREVLDELKQDIVSKGGIILAEF